MAMGRRPGERQGELWIATDEVAGAPRNLFYERLNALLSGAGFDRFVERLCEPFYAELGRPGIPPGVFFRMLFVGYFEGIDSQRQIAWRCSDSLSLKAFLGYGPFEATPDHSSLTNVRKRLPKAVFDQVFAFVLLMVAEHGLLRGEVLAGDATTLEANAAMRSIVRRDSGEDYDEFVRRLMAEDAAANAEAREEGANAEPDDGADDDPSDPTPEPTAEEVRRFDRRRRGKRLSNKQWRSETDGDARIVRMKDGRTRMGYKAEHVIDLDTEVVVSATVFHGDASDPATIGESLTRAEANLRSVEQHDVDAEEFDPTPRSRDVALDKGYHKSATLAELESRGLRTYVAEPDRGRRRWTDKPESWREATNANRRRVKGRRGRRLQRQRSERAERSFAHLCETGGRRRSSVRGLEDANKWYGVAAMAHNLGLLMRAMFGTGKPREFADRCAAACAGWFAVATHRVHRWLRTWPAHRGIATICA